jgi:hypothetical protein
MSKNARTDGELQFERYLDLMGYRYEFEKEYSGRAKRPDYTIHSDQVILADVKDFDALVPHLGFQQVDVHFRVREKIQAGYKKFKEYKDFTCCVVLQNNGNVHVSSQDPNIVLGCMYGTLAFNVPVLVGHDGIPNSTRPAPTLGFTGDAQMTAAKNTTISALLSLREVSVGVRRVRRLRQENRGMRFDDALAVADERFENFDYHETRLGVIVWENCHARLPLPRGLFVGAFDERYGLKDGYIQRIFCGTSLAELEPD